MNIINFIFFLFAVYLGIHVTYYLLLIAVHFLSNEKKEFEAAPKNRFAIVIPAHNEELFLARLLQSVSKQDYPGELFETIVVADNCTDKTAEAGLAHGAQVLERFDEKELGKGYAIKWALENIQINSFDAVFIIDADSIIKGDLLKELDKEFKKGKSIIQCYNGVANPEASWFTRLLDVSRTIGNEIYHPSKQKLGLSSYLMGNGMCFSTKILSKYDWQAFTVGEDWEYYVKLIMRGETIGFAKKARVFHQESVSLKQATSQRMRWSSGRFAIAWNYGLKLFLNGVLEGNLKKVDASLPLILPNPSLGINLTICMLILSFALNSMTAARVFLFLSLGQILIFSAGVLYTKNKAGKMMSLFIAPLFLIWKMGIDLLSFAGFGRKKWVSTKRTL
ncbi:MAG: glycosyltransferase family 2 protein [Deltaproteobacteria bacterium]|nr:glycosyltransferase family 2 protein [Deltaproteobacteria bacterium]